MKKTTYVIVLLVLIVLIGGLLILNNKNTKQKNLEIEKENEVTQILNTDKTKDIKEDLEQIEVDELEDFDLSPIDKELENI